MKSSRFIITLLSFVLVVEISTNLTRAQTTTSSATAPNANQPSLAAPTPYTVVARDANSATWERTMYEHLPTGRVVPRQHRYQELATGLNFKNQQTGQWLPSKEEIDIMPDGTAAATNGQHQAYFPGDIAQGVIELDTPDGLKLLSRPIALSLEDGTNIVLIAILTNSVGYLVGSNEVVYSNAFEGVKASLQYRYTKSGFEQNVVLEEIPPAPEAFGLDSQTAKLQVITEFFNTPQPAVTSRTIRTKTAMTLTDQRLSFGVMQMIPGEAFLLGTNSSSVSVAKQWLNVDGQQVLVEELPVASIADKLLQLPRPRAVYSRISPNSPLHVVSARRLLPPQHLLETGPNTQPKMQIAQSSTPARGLVLDYQTINSGSSNTDFTFQGDTTYYISGPVYFVSQATVYFEGGVVIKNAPFTGLYLQCASVWENSAYRPVIFTSTNDNSVGEAFGTGNPLMRMANPALQICGGVNPPNLSHIRISYAQVGIYLQDDDIDPGFTISDSQFTYCATAIVDHDFSGMMVENCLFATNYAVLDFKDTYGTFAVENSTLANCQYVVNEESWGGNSSWVSFTNCILANVPYFYEQYTLSSLQWGTNGFYNSRMYPTGSAMAVTNTFYPFQTVGGGKYYLANDCSFLAQGATNIDPALLTELRTKTTQPPVSRINNLGSTSWNITAARDTHERPDLGYHYDPIDYLAGGVAVNNVTLNLRSGVVVACVAVSSGQPAFDLSNGTLQSSGTPQVHNHICSYAAVQEEPTASLTGSNLKLIGSYYWEYDDYINTGWLQANFTDFDGMSGMGPILDSDTIHLTMQNCRVGPGGFSCLVPYEPNDPPTCTTVNNLFERAVVSYYDTDGMSPLVFYNNLLRNCTLNMGDYDTTYNWAVRDNSFGNSAISFSTSYNFTEDHNAYINVTGFTSTNLNKITLTVC